MPTSTCNLAVSDEDLIATVVRLLNAKSLYEAGSLLRDSKAIFEEIGYDNWDGGTYTFALRILLAPEAYVTVESRSNELESQIKQNLDIAVKQLTTEIFVVEIVPFVVGMPGRPDLEGRPLSLRTKRAISKILEQGKSPWIGTIDPVEFLLPLFELDKLPSTDSRFKDMAGDIWQHCVNNDDWA